MIQDVLDKILGVCDGATPEARKTGSGLVDRAAVTLEFYSVSYDQDGMPQGWGWGWGYGLGLSQDYALTESGRAHTIVLFAWPWFWVFTVFCLSECERLLDLPEWNACVPPLGTDVPVPAELTHGSSACAICWQGRPSRRASTRSAWCCATGSSLSSPSAARSPSVSLAGAPCLPQNNVVAVLDADTPRRSFRNHQFVNFKF